MAFDMKFRAAFYIYSFILMIQPSFTMPEPRFFMTFGFDKELGRIFLEKRGGDSDITVYEKPNKTSENLTNLIIPNEKIKSWEFMEKLKEEIFPNEGSKRFGDLIHGYEKKNGYIKVKFKSQYGWVHEDDFTHVLNYKDYFLLHSERHMWVELKGNQWFFDGVNGKKVLDYLPEHLKEENWPEKGNNGRPLYRFKQAMQDGLPIIPESFKIVDKKLWIKVNVCSVASQNTYMFMNCEKPIYYWFRPFDENGKSTGWSVVWLSSWENPRSE